MFKRGSGIRVLFDNGQYIYVVFKWSKVMFMNMNIFKFHSTYVYDPITIMYIVNGALLNRGVVYTSSFNYGRSLNPLCMTPSSFRMDLSNM